MSTSRPFAYNLGAAIPGTIQVGSLAVGTPTSGFSGSMEWWNGPDEDLGYVIAGPVPDDSQPTPVSGVTASVQFWRTSAFDNTQFINLANYVSSQSYTGATQASSGLTSLGYWNTYGLFPTPTPTTPSPTPTPTPTPGPLAIGEFYECGYIGYIFQPGDYGYISGETHGIIITAEQFVGYNSSGLTGTTWGCTGQTITGLTDSIGYGLINTDIIANWNTINCSGTPTFSPPLYYASGGSSNISALNLSTGSTYGSCTDWGIPTLTEMRAIITATTGMTQFNWNPTSGYGVNWLWTSTQGTGLSAPDNARIIRVLSTPPYYQDNFIPLKSSGVNNSGDANGIFQYRLIRYF